MSRAETKIRAIIFDLGNVLVRYDTKIAARRFAGILRVPVLKIWLFFFGSRLDSLYTRGKITTRVFYQKCKAGLGLSISFKTFAEIWNDIFWSADGMEALLAKLKKNYPLYMISNTNELHFNYLKKKFPEIFKPFRKCFASHRAGSRKPDLAIYQKALRAAKVNPEEAVFIDDIPAFVRGARKAGMRGICFKNKKQLIQELKKMGVRT